MKPKFKIVPSVDGFYKYDIEFTIQSQSFRANGRDNKKDCAWVIKMLKIAFHNLVVQNLKPKFKIIKSWNGKKNSADVYCVEFWIGVQGFRLEAQETKSDCKAYIKLIKIAFKNLKKENNGR
jgi:hypothetical protein